MAGCKFKWLLLAVLLAPLMAHGQNVRVDDVAFSAINNAPFIPSPIVTVNVCTNATCSSTTLALLCSSQSDATCSVPNPITGDNFGNYGYWVAPQTFGVQETISRAGFNSFTKLRATPCQLASTCTWSGAQTFSSNVAVGGTLGVTGNTTLNGGTLNGTYTGTPTFSGSGVTFSGNIAGPLTVSDTGNLQGFISKSTVDANQGACVANSVQNWCPAVRTDNSEAYIIRDVTSSNDRLKIPTGPGTMTLPNATDTIVGKATTDQLSNKTLTGASSGNSVILLNVQGPSGAITGTSADATAFTYTLPANTLGAGKCLEISFDLLHGTGAASPSYKLKFGSATLITVTGGASGRHFAVPLVHVCNNSGVTNAQSGMLYAAFDSTLITGTTSFTPAIDTTSNQAITVTFNVANTDTVTPQFFVVKLVQ